MVVEAYLNGIKHTLAMFYTYGQSCGSSNRRDMHAWKRIATFLHSNEISKSRLSEIFWMAIVRPIQSPDEAWMSVFRVMAYFFADMGITVHDFRPNYIEDLADW
jgi:hypothetical protein